ncbi:Linear gramicidin synthase subunit D [compost metagenome]
MLATYYSHNQLDYPKEKCVHTLFEEIAALRQDDIAVTCGIESLTYKELDSYSNQLANYLAEIGVSNEKSVCLCMDHSIWLLVSIIAVLKTGGNYVPIDPSYPSERINYILNDTKASVVITLPENTQIIPDGNYTIIEIGKNWTGFLSGNDTLVGNIHTSGNTACIIYTSGSTGRPKGVLITHQNLVALAYAGSKEFGLSEKDCFLQVASTSFSAALEELYPALLSGSRIVYSCDRKSLSSIHELINIVQRNQITVFEVTTAHWHELNEEIVNNNLRLSDSLRLVIMGGERAIEKHYNNWKKQNIELIHVYGPTETTATATYFKCNNYTSRNTENLEWRLPIGKAIANLEVYVLDDNLDPVPQGTRGELYVGGDLVTNGYLNQAILTAEKFLPNPFSKKLGDRMYKTGDNVMVLPDGNLEFLDRKDKQVKIRGFRIELSEIEFTIEKHSSVKQALLLIHDKVNGDKQMIAFILPEERQMIMDIPEIREFVAKYLPSYMVPESFIVVEKFPLTNNGKIDHKAVLSLFTDYNYSFAQIQPRNKMEQTLLEIWKNYTGITQFGVTDSFYEIGGNSIIAGRITAAMRSSLGVNLLPSLIFQKVTIEALSEHLLNQPLSQVEEEFRVIAKVKKKVQLISKTLTDQLGLNIKGLASVSQNGIWIISKMNVPKHLYNEPWILKMRGSLNEKALERALQTIIQRHEILQGKLTTLDGQPLIILGNESYSFNKVIANEDKARELINSEVIQPFDLMEGGLIRTTLYQISKEQFFLLFNFHHIIFDGLSMNLLLKELSILYKAFSESQNNPLPSLEVQYTDYAFWQRHRLKGDELFNKQRFWKEQLQNLDEIISFPSDFSRPEILSYLGKNMVISLSESETNSILNICRRNEMTLFVYLLAAFKILICHETKKNDIVIGTPVNGRNYSAFEPLIGLFINMLPIRSEVNCDDSILQLMNNIKLECLKAFNNQDITFDQIVEAVNPGRSRNLHPIFQILFELEEDPLQGIEDSTELSFIGIEDIPTNTAKYDVAVVNKLYGERLEISLTYSSDLFSEKTMRRILNSYYLIILCISEIGSEKLAEFTVNEVMKKSLKSEVDTDVGY